MTTVTLIALFGINSLDKTSYRNIEESALGTTHLILDGLIPPTTDLVKSIDVTEFAQIVSTLHIGQKGFVFVVQASDGKVLGINDVGAKTLAMPISITSNNVIKILNQPDNIQAMLALLSKPIKSGTDYGITTPIGINGNPYSITLRLIYFQTTTDQQTTATTPIIVGLVVSDAEMLASLKDAQTDTTNSAHTILLFQILATLLVLALVFVIAFILSRRLTLTLKMLTESTKLLAQKDYEIQLAIRSKDEFGQLAQSFNGMAVEIKQQIGSLNAANAQIRTLNNLLASENMHLKAEVEVTRKIQQLILPKTQELEHVIGLQIAGYMRPADEVGGDYYDVLMDQSEGGVKIGIGDVTGHGLESGMLMLMVQTAVRTLLASGEKDSARFLSILNAAIYDNVQRMGSDKNLSLSLLDYKDKQLRLSGQHEETIVVRATDGSVELIDTMSLGFPIGLEEDIEPFLAEQYITLASGDVVVLYTDGITEAENETGEQYGLERLCQLVQANASKSAEEIKQSIITNIFKYIGKQQIYDDITLLVLKQR
jgi:sigma-B regulation protein RsbU (phosphoserine phosphatase)